MAQKLSNFQFAQKRVLAERAYYRKLQGEGELSEQEILELNRAFAHVLEREAT